MTDELTRAAITTWAAKDLTARLDVVHTSKLPGFPECDIQILMAVGKLTPLGDPALNALKWFAAVEMIRLAPIKIGCTRPPRRLLNIGETSASAVRLHSHRCACLDSKPRDNIAAWHLNVCFRREG